MCFVYAAPCTAPCLCACGCAAHEFREARAARESLDGMHVETHLSGVGLTPCEERVGPYCSVGPEEDSLFTKKILRSTGG